MTVMIYNFKLKTTDIQRFSGLTILPDQVTCGLSFCTGLVETKLIGWSLNVLVNMGLTMSGSNVLGFGSGSVTGCCHINERFGVSISLSALSLDLLS